MQSYSRRKSRPSELLRKGLINYVREAYDEYYSTGQDPTGGEIGPELDPDMLEEYEEDQAILDDDSAPFMGGIRRLEQLVDQLEVQVDELIKRH